MKQQKIIPDKVAKRTLLGIFQSFNVPSEYPVTNFSSENMNIKVYHRIIHG